MTERWVKATLFDSEMSGKWNEAWVNMALIERISRGLHGKDEVTWLWPPKSVRPFEVKEVPEYFLPVIERGRR